MRIIVKLLRLAAPMRIRFIGRQDHEYWILKYFYHYKALCCELWKSGLRPCLILVELLERRTSCMICSNTHKREKHECFCYEFLIRLSCILWFCLSGMLPHFSFAFDPFRLIAFIFFCIFNNNFFISLNLFCAYINCLICLVSLFYLKKKMGKLSCFTINNENSPLIFRAHAKIVGDGCAWCSQWLQTFCQFA